MQLLLTVDLMHRKGIYHRDIKPENILILDKQELKVCIADLGLACRVSANNNTDDVGQHLTFKCGTPGYVAPELLKGFAFSSKSDVFSLGCLFFNMVTGKMLFHG
jgi:serine/threonine protein kinase